MLRRRVGLIEGSGPITGEDDSKCISSEVMRSEALQAEAYLGARTCI